VTASQPTAAGKPVVLHPTAEPLVISVNALEPTEYSQGFMNPRTGLPAAIRASLTSEMMDAAVGVAALLSRIHINIDFFIFNARAMHATHLVPSTLTIVPFQTIRNCWL
jgi:hypothetical protein